MPAGRVKIMANSKKMNNYPQREYSQSQMDELERKLLGGKEQKPNTEQKDVQVSFVTVSFSEKQILDSFPGKNGKEYSRILAPNGMTYLHPTEKIRDDQYHEGRKVFFLPEGTEITMSKNVKKPDVPEDAPNSIKYEKIKAVMKVEELKAAYDSARKDFKEARQKEWEAENNKFVHLEISEKLVKLVPGKNENEGKNFARISIPMEENGSTKFYSFLVNERAVRDSDKDGKKMVGLLKEKEDGQPFVVKMKYSEKQPDGSYKEFSKEMSSVQLEAALKENAQKYKESLQADKKANRVPARKGGR